MEGVKVPTVEDTAQKQIEGSKEGLSVSKLKEQGDTSGGSFGIGITPEVLEQTAKFNESTEDREIKSKINRTDHPVLTEVSKNPIIGYEVEPEAINRGENDPHSSSYILGIKAKGSESL